MKVVYSWGLLAVIYDLFLTEYLLNFGFTRQSFSLSLSNEFPYTWHVWVQQRLSQISSLPCNVNLMKFCQATGKLLGCDLNMPAMLLPMLRHCIYKLNMLESVFGVVSLRLFVHMLAFCVLAYMHNCFLTMVRIWSCYLVMFCCCLEFFLICICLFMLYSLSIWWILLNFVVILTSRRLVACIVSWLLQLLACLASVSEYWMEHENENKIRRKWTLV